MPIAGKHSDVFMITKILFIDIQTLSSFSNSNKNYFKIQGLNKIMGTSKTLVS